MGRCARIRAVWLLGALLWLSACEPKDRRPGLWLSGEPVQGPVTDWSFTDSVPEIFLETRTWYGIPHSVTVVCVAIGDRLYVPSVYRERGEFPDERAWNRNVVRDPRVRLEIAGKLYERRAVLVEDPAEWRAVLDIVDCCETDRDVFVTELIVRAQYLGLAITEIPIAVHEIRPAPINIYRRVPKALRQVMRLWRLSRGWKAQSMATRNRQVSRGDVAA